MPWTPGALDPPLPDYVVRYQQRCLAASADAATEPEEPAAGGTAPSAAINTDHGTVNGTGNDTVSFQRKILPNAAEIHPGVIEADEGAAFSEHQVSACLTAMRSKPEAQRERERERERRGERERERHRPSQLIVLHRVCLGVN